MPRCRAVARVHVVIVGDVVATVLAGRGLERHEPQRRDAETLQVVQAPAQPLEIPDAVAVGILEGADGEAVDDRVLVPEVVDHDEGPARSKLRRLSERL